MWRDGLPFIDGGTLKETNEILPHKMLADCRVSDVGTQR